MHPGGRADQPAGAPKPHRLQKGRRAEGRERSLYSFVVIDEAFDRGSDDSTCYALDLFRKLNLRLLIVTPMQKIHIIVDYINAVHFVHNEGGHNSIVRNLTVQAYREEKARFLRVGAA